MPSLEFGVQQAQVRVRIKVLGAGGEIATHEVPSGQFEAAELGVQIGQLFVPWGRVVEYDRIVRQEAVTDRTRDAAKLRVRIVVDDGAEGETHDVPADRFEKSAMTLTMLFDRHVEPDTGMLEIQKLFIPWHRVVSYERYTEDPALRPEVVRVPDATGVPEAIGVPGGIVTPSRPDVP